VKAPSLQCEAAYRSLRANDYRPRTPEVEIQPWERPEIGPTCHAYVLRRAPRRASMILTVKIGKDVRKIPTPRSRIGQILVNTPITATEQPRVIATTHAVLSRARRTRPSTFEALKSKKATGSIRTRAIPNRTAIAMVPASIEFIQPQARKEK
jgi:hypothetical protein